MKKEVYKITGMSCSGCAARVKQAAMNVPGVRSAEVELEKGLLLVENEDAEAREIVEAVERMGFGAQGPQE